MAVKTVIVDDEKLAREIIKKYLSGNDSFEVAAECSNGFEAIKKINEINPGLIFLDIQMPKINGFEMLELLDNPPVIIFTTAYDQYALKAFEVNAVDYLLKPYSHERFNESLDKALFYLNNKGKQKEVIKNLIKHDEKNIEYLERIIVKNGQEINIIPADQIRFIEAQDDYVMFYTDSGKFLKQKTMKFFEEHLNPKDFIRIHRSYIAAISRIKKIDLIEKETYKVILEEGIDLPVSKSGYDKLKNFLK